MTGPLGAGKAQPPNVNGNASCCASTGAPRTSKMVCKHCHTFLSQDTANGNVNSHNPEPEICLGGCVNPQQQPTSLGIVHEWHALRELVVPLTSFSRRSSQDLQPLPCCGQLWGSSPDHCIWNPHSSRCGDDVDVLRNNKAQVLIISHCAVIFSFVFVHYEFRSWVAGVGVQFQMVGFSSFVDHAHQQSPGPGWGRSVSAAQPKPVQRVPQGRWRQTPRINPDKAHEKAQSTVTRFEKALEAMGDVQGSAVEVLKSELTKARAASKQLPLDVEIDQCRKYISRAEKRIKELDAQREEESTLFTEAQERLQRLVNTQPRALSTVFLPESGDQVLSLQQMVNVLQSERDALVKELHKDQDIHLAVKKQAVSRQVGSRREPRCAIPVMPQFVPNDVTNRLQDRLQGDLQHVSELGTVMSEGVNHLSHRDHVIAAIIRGEHDHRMKFENVVSHQCGFEGCRVGEASNPGPRIRRLLRPVDGRDVARRTTQEDNDSDAPLLRPVVANVEGETMPASSDAVVAFRRGGDNELLLHRASDTIPSVPGEFPHPTRRSARLQSMGYRGSPGVVGVAIHLTLIDSSDDDAPFIVPGPAGGAACPSRRSVLVPGSVDSTPQSTQDCEWTAEHAAGSESVPATIFDALEEDLEQRNRRLLLVSGSQGVTVGTDFPQSEVVGTIVEDSDADEDVAVSPARSVEIDRPGGVFDTSDTESLNAEDVRGGASDIEGEEEIDEDIPEVAIDGVSVRDVSAGLSSLDQVNMRDVFERRAIVIVMRTIPQFLRGAFAAGLRVALDECALGHAAGDQTRITRAWKLFLLFPRMLLWRLPRGGKVSRKQMQARCDAFNTGAWRSLIDDSMRVAHQGSANASCQRRRESVETIWIDAPGGRCSWFKWENVQQDGMLSKEHRLLKATMPH